jgi:pilus assembly protein CpaB
MKSKTMILMVVAVGCGLVASFLTSRLLAERGKTPEGPVMRKFLVAKKNLPVGTVLKEPEKYFEEKEFPEDSAPKKGFESFDAVQNRKLSKPISADAPLSRDDLMDGAKGDFEQSIPVGHEAIAIKVNPESIVGGFVRPYSKVDVIWTWNRGADSLSKTILQNLLVLAADQEPGRGDGDTAKLATTVTLAVKPDEAQKITLAASQGQLVLKLRRQGDEEINNTRQITVTDLIKGHDTSSGTTDPADDPDTKNPKTIKPVVDPTVPTETPVVKDEEKYFVQTFQNGESRTVVKHPLSGKDGETKVEKTDPVVGPKTPEKKSDSGKNPTKPKIGGPGEKDPDDY